MSEPSSWSWQTTGVYEGVGECTGMTENGTKKEIFEKGNGESLEDSGKCRNGVVGYKYDLSGCISSMAFNLDQLTDKARESVGAALQLATDYANSQCTSSHPSLNLSKQALTYMQCTPCTLRLYS